MDRIFKTILFYHIDFGVVKHFCVLFLFLLIDVYKNDKTE